VTRGFRTPYWAVSSRSTPKPARRQARRTGRDPADRTAKSSAESAEKPVSIFGLARSRKTNAQHSLGYRRTRHQHRAGLAGLSRPFHSQLGGTHRIRRACVACDARDAPGIRAGAAAGLLCPLATGCGHGIGRVGSARLHGCQRAALGSPPLQRSGRSGLHRSGTASPLHLAHQPRPRLAASGTASSGLARERAHTAGVAFVPIGTFGSRRRATQSMKKGGRSRPWNEAFPGLRPADPRRCRRRPPAAAKPVPRLPALRWSDARRRPFPP